MLRALFILQILFLAGLQGVTLQDYAERLNMQTAELKMALLQMDVDDLKAQLNKEKKVSITAIDHEMRAKKYTLKKMRAELLPLKRSFAIKKDLYEKGLISKNEYRNLQHRLAEKRREIKLEKAALITLWASLRKEKITPEMRARQLNYLQELQFLN